eukprot:7132662-Pyramimonas_sp.AAC.1
MCQGICIEGSALRNARWRILIEASSLRIAQAPSLKRLFVWEFYQWTHAMVGVRLRLSALVVRAWHCLELVGRRWRC